MVKYNGPLVKTTNSEIIVNTTRSKSEPVRPRAETLGSNQAAVPLQVALGRLRSIRRRAGAALVAESDPIPPFAVASHQPAKRVLSRAAGRDMSCCGSEA